LTPAPCGGGLWPPGSRKYRITNITWCTHNILFGRLTSSAKAAGVGPRGRIGTARPAFGWNKAALASRCELHVCRGGKLLVKKTGARQLSWKVPAGNAAGHGSFSRSFRSRIR